MEGRRKETGIVAGQDFSIAIPSAVSDIESFLRINFFRGTVVMTYF